MTVGGGGKGIRGIYIYIYMYSACGIFWYGIGGVTAWVGFSDRDRDPTLQFEPDGFLFGAIL